jgi:hypothetical protein
LPRFGLLRVALALAVTPGPDIPPSREAGPFRRTVEAVTGVVLTALGLRLVVDR